ncbi:hypothetical protein D9758_005068 [Tetrapyrgos nigripes]|uniref:NADP-dependent oxidoreductase domain-containing protein n=1 Tax=Tetrapyrgos nigripes TaxID=182062 RepID=A0A8H5LWK7_9AGAR|nr:hypothetical protein D9758_005068 [Tetrapyrgos nigripes]
MGLAPRKVGDVPLNPIGFGAMGISIAYGKVDTDEERLKLLDAVYESGCNHWDTADIYGDSEELLGKWFKRTGKRDSIFLATKFGITPQGNRGTPEYVREQCEKSLKGLGVDHIDLFYQHRVDPNTPIETTIAAMAELVKEGKVKYLGISDCTASGLRRAHAVHPISALQVEFSPFWLDIESPQLNLVQTARELGIKIVVYSPLARGLITGQIRSPDDFEPTDFRRTVPKYGKDNFPKILATVEQIAEIGKKHNATPSQVTLAWILAQGDDFLVIPGTKKLKYLQENMAAANVQLSQEEIAKIRKIAEECNLPGGYADWLAAISYVESPPL